jgi:hypothetical protein
MVAIVLFLISTSGVNTLLLPASPVGMTTPFSVSKDAEAIFYNPANFRAQDNYQIWCSYNRFYLSMQSVSLALSKKIKNINFGIAFLNFDFGDIEWHADYPSEDSLTYYSGNDFTMVLGGSVPITAQGTVGLNLKYISESIYIYSNYALAFDVSFAYIGTKAGITFGAANIGSKLTLHNESVNLPARISIGTFYDFKKFVPSIDIHYLVNTAEFEGGFGIDVPVHKIVNLNGTAHYRDVVYPGFGLAIRPGNLTIKYAGALYPHNLGLVNTLGIGFEF